MTRIIVYGAGGHGKVVIDAIESSLPYGQILGVIDDNVDLHGTAYAGYSVLGGFDELRKYDGSREYKDYGLVVAIARNAIRKRIYKRVCQLACDLITVVHSTALIAKGVVIGPGSMIMAGAIVNPGVTLGTSVVINTGSIIEHDCVVHDFVHVGPGCIFAGAVEAGESSFIGVGARVLPSVRIGRGAIVAAGSVVTRDVPDGTTVVGVPAEPLGGRTS